MATVPQSSSSKGNPRQTSDRKDDEDKASFVATAASAAEVASVGGGMK